MSDAATTARALVAVLLTVAVVAPAAEKAPLRNEFQHLYAEFGQKTMVRLSTISGPKAVKMRRDQLPGKQWMVTTGSYNFKLTIQDKADYSIEKLMGMLEKLPAIYLSAGVAASDDGEDGIAVYADLGGATSSGGLGYIDMLPTANAGAMVRALGRALAEEAKSKDEKIPEQWMAASRRTPCRSPPASVHHGAQKSKITRSYMPCAWSRSGHTNSVISGFVRKRASRSGQR